MALKHIRIDDRLIHGQVLIGWGSRYNYDTFIICDKELADSEWEKEMYLAAVPGDFIGEVLAPGDIQKYIIDHPDACILLLLKSTRSLMELVETGFEIKEVIIGGIHDKAGRKHFYDFIYLSPEEISHIKDLIDKGIHFIGQDLPDHPAHEISALLNKSN